MKRKKTANRIAVIAIAELFIFSISPLPTYLIRRLEQQYKPLKHIEANNNLPILVLGGGHTYDTTLVPSQQISATALSRLTEGIRLYNEGNKAPLILSGYTKYSTKPAHAKLMAETAISLGVKAKDTIMLTQPAVTWEEAIAFKKRFGNDKKLILVTSAYHMPRAIKTFKRVGLNPVPAPTDYQVKHDTDNLMYNWKPSSEKIKYTTKALHEYAGMLYYKWFKTEK
ncbi:membrane protein [Flavobacterium suaedae]|uniref:Membrane protein n=1 Tax=Flavobacterium suaedae TaxID=1767027 RepID=A0ABQ1JKM4_9FLAO|nr:YdcF family protein [Flavobacterium suaedae]GGB68650.1 membrane protein [Flavobacterium suaedae]